LLASDFVKPKPSAYPSMHLYIRLYLNSLKLVGVMFS